MRNRSVYKEYFPFTEKCPVDGRDCVRSDVCKMWSYGFNLGSCWYIDFNTLIFEIFNSDYSHYICFKDKENRIVDGIRHLGLYLDFGEKLDNKAVELEIRICFNSHRLAEKIREKFDLEKWCLESASFEGGDDADLKLRVPGSRENCNQIKEFLIQIRDKLMPSIIEAEVMLNTCAICKEKSWILNEYSSKAICATCEYRIITENIDRYC